MATTAAEQRLKLLNNFFEKEDDRRFVCEQQIGQGGQSFVFKVKCELPLLFDDTGLADTLGWITLKFASFTSQNELESLQTEADILKANGCAHTVHLYTVHDDPLQELKDKFGWAWMYLEYLEYGTLGQFIERYSMAMLSNVASHVPSPEVSRAVSRVVSPTDSERTILPTASQLDYQSQAAPTYALSQRTITSLGNRTSTQALPTASELNYRSQAAPGISRGPSDTSSQLATASQLGALETASPPRLPNRLLLRFFLCMVRACIGMSWPENNCDGKPELASRNQLGKATNIRHNDIHIYNMMFGPLYADGEHDKVPILTLIDFGLATMEGSVRSARRANIADMGTLMATIMCGLTDSRYSGEEIVVDLSDVGLHEELDTPASRILPDPDARHPIDPLPDIDMNLRRVVAACMALTPGKRPTLRWLEDWLTTALVLYPTSPEFESDESITNIVQSFSKFWFAFQLVCFRRVVNGSGPKT
ncbi:hypothetical protein GGR57DRAFT_504356 [Xylariaceae sp. FL1272]|nr:hypothetical protein GGR57DRAFT_504356 [Xylariaceae sp. FL1272]